MAFYKYDQTSNKLIPITSEGSVGIPVGAVMAFAKGTTHENWLLCDGRDTTGTADELQTHYPALYTYLGNSNVLPDYRECVLVGVGQNDTDTIAEHDVYTLGQFKDDQLQEHTHDLPTELAQMEHYVAGAAQSWAKTNTTVTVSHTKTSTVTNTYRTGTTTHGKQKGVAYYIKATSAGIEVDKDLYATKGYVNDAVSYSTTEQLTGGTWIDGKKIYRRVSTTTGSASGWGNILVNDFNAQTILKCFVIESGNFTSVPSYVTTNQSGYIRCYFPSGGISVGATVVLEYTKTTD